MCTFWAANYNVEYISAFVAKTFADQTCSPGWELALGFCSDPFNLEVDSVSLFLAKCAPNYNVGLIFAFVAKT